MSSAVSMRDLSRIDNVLTCHCTPSPDEVIPSAGTVQGSVTSCRAMARILLESLDEVRHSLDCEGSSGVAGKP